MAEKEVRPPETAFLLRDFHFIILHDRRLIKFAEATKCGESKLGHSGLPSKPSSRLKSITQSWISQKPSLTQVLAFIAQTDSIKLS